MPGRMRPEAPLQPTFPAFRVVGGQDCPSGRLEQGKIARRMRGTQTKPPVDRADALKRVRVTRMELAGSCVSTDTTVRTGSSNGDSR
jgi:hypothetical protein